MKKLFAAVFVLAAVPLALSASVINFAGFADEEVLTTQTFGDGVTFAGATILKCCDTDGTGSLNNAQFPPPTDDGGSTDGVNVAYNPSGPLTLNFTSPSAFFSAAFTYNQGLTVTAYNASSTVIAVANGACGASGSGANYVGSGCGAPDEVIGVTIAGISKIVITGGTGNNFTIDDVSFTGSINSGAAPEPGTIMMLLTGLGCLAVFGRKRLTA